MSLEKMLQQTKAYRDSRMQVAQWILDHPETFSELLKYCYQLDKEISYRATWILEFVCKEKLFLLFPHLDLFTKKLPAIKKDQALRPMAKIVLMITQTYYKNRNLAIKNFLKPTHKKILVECCFDWLITNQKVACQAYAMSSLYYLGTEIKWIHKELQQIIEQNIHQQSAAYKARGRMTIEQIRSFKK
ncbi:MAG: adenylosuccinate lyase [Flavobacteriales bacterium]